MKFIKLAGIAGVALLIGGLSGCAELGKVTGGGWMPSEDGDGKANFGFNADSCNAYPMCNEAEGCLEWAGIEGKFNYNDKNAEVKMNGDIVGAMLCSEAWHGIINPSECQYCENGYLMQLDYRSTNPKQRGVGTAWACVYDNGEGVNAEFSDGAGVYVEDGPYEGYTNTGMVQGNIQAHECEEEDMLGVAF